MHQQISRSSCRITPPDRDLKKADRAALLSSDSGSCPSPNLQTSLSNSSRTRTRTRTLFAQPPNTTNNNQQPQQQNTHKAISALSWLHPLSQFPSAQRSTGPLHVSNNPSTICVTNVIILTLPPAEYNSTSTSGGLSPLKPTSMFAATGLTHLDESDFVSQHRMLPRHPPRL